MRVEEELEAYPTASVDLRCQFIEGGGKTKLTQVGKRKTTFCFSKGKSTEAQAVKIVDVLVLTNGVSSLGDIEGDD